jgi:hypothetical protein
MIRKTNLGNGKVKTKIKMHFKIQNRWGWAGVDWLYNIVLYFPLDLFRFLLRLSALVIL